MQLYQPRKDCEQQAKPWRLTNKTQRSLNLNCSTFSFEEKLESTSWGSRVSSSPEWPESTSSKIYRAITKGDDELDTFLINRTRIQEQECRRTSLKLFRWEIFSQNAHLVRSITPDGAARIFLPPYATAGIWTHVSRVAPTRDLLKDALPTELPRRGYNTKKIVTFGALKSR